MKLKDCEIKNGVRRPAVGSKARAIWDWCDDILETSGGESPRACDVEGYGQTKDWNSSTCNTQFYLWRKFHGFKGRKF